ncbi:hypothetical protein PFISCL1PPCAC_8094 [Pristionchus fissidentatus]|uniref:EF-hand domain-containing protein n=1 Tax=Pristionchus fissidentatus TaxID=1538716 RepID=A0AAV5VF65_9BILA|nr:hypothetical protein PFISCL1PPCAC_8094 [Pristionchus fissidentatus]
MEELQKAHPHIDPFLIQKWERIFSVFFDRNSSKKMDWGDFYLVTRKVREIYGAESAQWDFARQALAALWEGLCKMADADHDQLISLNEWIGTLGKIDQKHPQKWFADYRNFMFQLFDVSKDGVLDMAEYCDGMLLYGVRASEAQQAFTAMTNDPYAKLKPEQWGKFFDELFFSKDKSAKGNHLFGIVLSQ